MLLSKRTDILIFTYGSCASLLDCCSCELMFFTGNLCTEFCGSHWPRAFGYLDISFLSLIHQTHQTLHPGIHVGQWLVHLKPVGKSAGLTWSSRRRWDGLFRCLWPIGHGPHSPHGPQQWKQKQSDLLVGSSWIASGILCRFHEGWYHFRNISHLRNWRSAFLVKAGCKAFLAFYFNSSPIVFTFI